MLSKAFCSAILVFGVSGIASQAHAGTLYDPSVSGCATTNCSSIAVGATLLSFNSSSAGTWTDQIFAAKGLCLRIQVFAATVDLEMTVVGPNGSVWRNDNAAAGNNRPLVKINNTPVAGWYTVVVGQASGVPFDSDFQVAFGVYSTNPNCVPATPPL
jgi:hypothetical protein